jgi:hypothetical protein
MSPPKLSLPRVIHPRSAQNDAFNGQKGLVIDTLNVLPTVQAVANGLALIVRSSITGDGVRLPVQSQNTKLFNEMHTSSLEYA